MKKQVTIMVTTALVVEMDVNENESVEDKMNTLVENCSYEFESAYESHGEIVSTEIVEQELGAITDI